MEVREELIRKILKGFLKDLSESAKPFNKEEELLYFIQALREYLEGMASIIPPNDVFEEVYFDGDEFLRKTLLSKFRNKMVPFVKTSLKYYFAKDDYTQGLLFKKLNIQQPPLNYTEYEDYVNRINGCLARWYDQIILNPGKKKTEDILEVQELTGNSKITSEAKLKNPEYTRGRQALLYYYLLKLAGINIRQDSSLAAYSRFGHALSNWPYTSLDNSPLYEFLKKVPYIKRDRELVVDLEWCRRQFEDINNTEGIAMVQKEIDSINKK